MTIDEYNEKDIKDTASIRGFIESIESQQREMILTSGGNTVGAILTSAQYEWFLDQMDMQQDMTFVNERPGDLSGSQTLDELKKEFD
ncbi:MAG: hypothetical protein JKY01_00875 [Pseudomonadales bacterium]|nr:hypothetical protein [Pseudomonadales bacterium]